MAGNISAANAHPEIFSWKTDAWGLQESRHSDANIGAISQTLRTAGVLPVFGHPVPIDTQVGTRDVARQGGVMLA